nr:hypothetical protein [Tanacetum cinerariifolium]
MLFMGGKDLDDALNITKMACHYAFTCKVTFYTSCLPCVHLLEEVLLTHYTQPLHVYRGFSVETLKSQIFILSRVKNSDALRRMNPDDVKKIEYCLPYVYNPFKEDEIEQSTTVDIMYTIEPKHINCFLDLLYVLCRKMRKMINQRAKLDKKKVVCKYDWEMDELEVSLLLFSNFFCFRQQGVYRVNTKAKTS